MFTSYRSLLRVLPLIMLFLAGQLQAKTVITCKMMDKTAHNAMMDMDMQQGAECCLDHKSCLSLDCDDAPGLSPNSCYEKTVVLSINQDLQQDLPILNLLVESDVDPPQVIITTLDFVFPSQTVTTFLIFPRTNTVQSDSNIYLITQRLRI